jgi:hypothetical protein
VTPEFTHLSRFLTADADSIGFAAIQKIPAAMDTKTAASPTLYRMTPSRWQGGGGRHQLRKDVDNLYGHIGVSSCTPPKPSTCDKRGSLSSHWAATPDRSSTRTGTS